MEGPACLQASQGGYRAHVTKTFGRITEITDSTKPITPSQMISLRTALEQLQQKKVKLEEVDTRIADSIQDATALEEGRRIQNRADGKDSLSPGFHQPTTTTKPHQ